MKNLVRASHSNVGLEPFSVIIKSPGLELNRFLMMNMPDIINDIRVDWLS